MAITKNRQSEETISRMAEKAFPDKKVATIKELTEGMCNVTYDIRFEDGSESILKIAAKDRSGNTSNEIGLMRAEIDAMKLVSANCSFKVADVQYYDTSNTICDGNYFFMEKLDGDNYSFVKGDMSEEEIAAIDTEIGKISRELSNVKNPGFGFLGDDKRYDSLFGFVRQMLENLITDAKRRDIDILYDEKTFMDLLEKDRHAFEEVRSASLVHWDMWEGNVFVKDGHVSGIIDWERALWGEPFMDDRFRMHNRGRHFLEGFGQTSFSEVESIRLRWYDVILYLTMMIEVYYREFEDKGQYYWAKEMLEKSMCMPVYKQADISDADVLIDIYDSAFRDDYLRYGECPAYGRSREDMEQSVRDFPKIIAYDQGKPVGVISYKEEGPGKYYIGCLAVVKEEQGRGIGTLLMKHFMSERPDWTELTLVTPKDNEQNIRFYTGRFGFEIVGEEVDGAVTVFWFKLSR